MPHRFRASTLSILEIYTYPLDLEISIRRKYTNNKKWYGTFISRGPGGNFKLLVSPPPYVNTLNEILEITRANLTYFKDEAKKTYKRRRKWYNRADIRHWPKPTAIVLSDELIEEIVITLRQRGRASTYKSLGPSSKS